MTARRSLSSSLVIGAVIACLTGCAETSASERAASQLEATARASQYKDQQIHALTWQIATLANQLRYVQAQGDAAQRELAQRLDQVGQTNAACADRLRQEEAERQRLAATLAAADAAKGGRARPDDLRRLIATLDAQNARLMERIGRLEQKLDARAAEDREAARQRAARPDRPAEGDIVDPWGFGARK